MNFSAANIQTINAPWLLQNQISLDILRLDKIHPIVSGNKWFKLKYYLHEALQQNKPVATFGGAWSNHIVAVACCCQMEGIQSIGFIRGEKPAVLSETLKKAAAYGMELHYLSREEYRSSKMQVASSKPKWLSGLIAPSERDVTINNEKEISDKEETGNGIYWISEGGYGSLGAKGAADIGKQYDLKGYTHIVAGVGTGTMLAGLLLSAAPHQKIIGISAMKGNVELEKQVLDLIGAKEDLPQFSIMHDYHFGGFAKHPPQLIDFMNHVYADHQLPLDIVYTGKAFFAVQDLANKKYFEPTSKVLMIHSGGLQGNEGMKEKNLAF